MKTALTKWPLTRELLTILNLLQTVQIILSALFCLWTLVKLKNRWNVFINGGITDTGTAVEWAKSVSLGAGEILLTSIDTDGMKKDLILN